MVQTRTPGSRLRRVLSLTAAGAMVMALLPAGAAVAQDGEARDTDLVCDPPYESTFPDVPGSAHEDNVYCMADHGLTEGLQDGVNYGPRRDVTRGQMASFIARFIEDYTDQTLEEGEGFSDVPDGTEYDHAANIRKLDHIAVVEGTNASDGAAYAPQDVVARGQMASMISRALSYIETGEAQPEEQPPRTDTSHFPDAIPDRHEGNVNALADVGIVEGFNAGDYRWRDATKRDQMASFVMRAYDWAVDVDLGDDPPVDPDDGSISGTTFDEDTDSPIEGVEISAEGVESDTTGDDGTYTLTEVAAGDYTVTASSPWYEDADTSVSVAEGEDVTGVDFFLSALDTGSISGTVVGFDEDGDTAPIEGANVSIDGLDTSVRTGEDGTYSFSTVPVGDHEVTAQAETYESETQTVTVEADEDTVANFELTLPEEPEGPLEPGDVTFFVEAGDLGISEEEFELSECPGGEPAEDECIEFNGVLDEDGNLSFDADGVYFPLLEDTTDTPIGEQDLVVDITAPDGATGTLSDDGSLDVDMVLEIGIAVGELTDDTCHIPDVSIQTTTGDSGEVSGSPLDDGGQATVVDGLFEVDEAQDCGELLGIEIGGLINDELGLPSGEGENSLEFNLLAVQG